MAGVEDLSPADLSALKLGRALASKPEIRREVQRLYKQADPTVVIPALEAEEQIRVAREEDGKRLDKLEKDNMELRVANRVQERKEQCAKEGVSYDDVCKIVVDERCAFETGIKILKLQQQTAEPGPGDVAHGGQGTPQEILPGAEFRKAGGNLAALRRVSAQVAGDMINGFRGRTRGARA